MYDYDIIYRHGWEFACYTSCHDGHTEEVFSNPKRPGILLHKNCVGTWRVRKGVIAEKTVIYPKWEKK